MSEFKFSCGQCGQHITADDAWAGHQIKCPNCQGDIVIPRGAVPVAASPMMAPPPPPPISIAAQRPAPPPALHPGGTSYQPAAARVEAPVKFWLLALASPFLMLMVIPLVLIGIGVTQSWLGGLISLAACIPALLCARAALEERDTRRGVRESQLSGVGALSAWVGMVLGYIWLVLLLIGFCRFSYYKITGTAPPQSRWSASASQNGGGQPATPRPYTTPPVVTTPARPAEPPAKTDPQSVTIPDSVVSGTVLGGAFTCTSVSYNPSQSLLEINQGSASNPQANSIKLFLWMNAPETLAGKNIMVTPGTGLGAKQPHVHLSRSGTAGKATTDGYVLRLEFSEPDQGRLTAHLYLELPQSYGTKVSGTFKIVAK